MPTARVWGILVLWLSLTGCEGVTHENIERWESTQKGPDKLREALLDPTVSPELRAHAAQILVRLDEADDVRRAVDQMGGEKAAVVTALVERLWADARITDNSVSVRQERAKDVMFDLREVAEPATREKIDGYVVEWLTSGPYDPLAAAGRHRGVVVIRTVGPMAGPALLSEVRSIIARPPDAEGKRLRVGDGLLTALAASGHPEALAFLLQLVGADRSDPTLPERAMSALYRAYIEPQNFPAGDPTNLVPHLDSLVKIAGDPALPGRASDDAVELIQTVGPPACTAAFLEMITHPHSNPVFKWIGVERAVRCGGLDAVVEVAERLPPTDSYRREDFERYFWKDILGFADSAAGKAKVRSVAHELLESESWIARISGVELLGRLGDHASAAEDASKIRELTGDKTPLLGFGGEDARRDPTLGSEASRVAKLLEEVAK